MRKFIFCITVCFVFNTLHAQTISGIIYDSKTKETIPGVVVYLNGTTIITTSDKDGKFNLVVGNNINTNLVFSHLSYEPLIVEKPFDHITKAFYLSEKVSTLAEARVVADRYSRAAKMKVFKEQFLGTSVAGKACVIVNEEDITLKYDYEINSLIAHSSQPIIVENKYLAYRIFFDLHSFCVQYSDKTLDIDEATKILFFGTSSFVDLSPYNIMYAKRREETYLRSCQNFWKNFTSRSLEQANFRIYNRYRQIEQDPYFLISPVAFQNRVTLIPDTDLHNKHNSVVGETILGVVGVVYKSQIRSEIVFLTHTLSIDEFGNPDAIDKLMYFGDMGTQRLGDLLPSNFVYVPK